ncbi:outer membrane protein assembly factor BamB [Candidatus Thiothrix anitrata]|uniref:Outer membrane protein assembly factor BamB n=1 Tax=Candidatus Thiothrix anitrata TaxID=2823902 RepID=A0ABX7X0H5_9GAMM|nr:outer membrane protein assembly factor BamB [Candidatus Thiothrix anitrata]QTR49417.1 outer membrane protein assembly factor BamB [Candidatus Thiothrix anitrata]
MKPVVGLLLASSLLAGCSSVQEVTSSVLPPSEARQPQKLQDFVPQATVRTLWQVKTGSSNRDAHVRIQPYLNGNALFVAGGNSVSAWDKTNGKRLWQANINQGTISGGVSCDNLHCYLGTSNANAIAVDANTGQERWRTRLTGEVFGVSEAQTGKVVFRTGDGRLHGINAATGAHLWQQARPANNLSLRGAGVPLIVGSMVIAGFDSGVVTAFDLQSGTTLWETRLALSKDTSDLSRMIDVDGKLKALGEALFAASNNGQIAGINMRNGTIAWSAPYSSNTGVEADTNGLYTTNAAGDVWRLEPRTGSPLWKLDSLRGRQPSVPGIAGQHVIVADQQGYLHWIKAQNGQLAARIAGDSAGYAVPPLTDGNVSYGFGRDGLLSAFVLE